jgi:hypothetical protein
MLNDHPTIVYGGLEIKLQAFLTPIKYGVVSFTVRLLYDHIQDTVWTV